jgi:hypothetical protein
VEKKKKKEDGSLDAHIANAKQSNGFMDVDDASNQYVGMVPKTSLKGIYRKFTLIPMPNAYDMPIQIKYSLN